MVRRESPVLYGVLSDPGFCWIACPQKPLMVQAAFSIQTICRNVQFFSEIFFILPASVRMIGMQALLTVITPE